MMQNTSYKNTVDKRHKSQLSQLESAQAASGLARIKWLAILAVAMLTLAACCSQDASKNSAEAGAMNQNQSTLDAKSASTNSDAKVEEIEEITIEVANFDETKTNLRSWLSVFSRTEDGKGTKERVHSYSSEQALIDDTLSNMGAASKYTGADYLANTMAARAAEKVDFSTQDMAVVFLTDGGPPFGDFVMQKTTTGFSFCIKRAASDSPIRGRALKSTLKFYSLPKGETVTQC